MLRLYASAGVDDPMCRLLGELKCKLPSAYCHSRRAVPNPGGPSLVQGAPTSQPAPSSQLGVDGGRLPKRWPPSARTVQPLREVRFAART